jgi:hypothetical protein
MPRKPADKPEPPEGSPVAQDGEPNENELAARRAAKEQGAAGGTSIAERAANGDDTEPEEELFPLGSLTGDPAVTLKNLLKPRVPVEISASMGTAAVPIKGSGFFDPEAEVTLLVRVLPGGPVPVATRKKGDEKSQIEKWRITQPLTPIFVQEAGDMYTREQVLELLHEAGVNSSTVSRLMGETAPAAGSAG